MNWTWWSAARGNDPGVVMPDADVDDALRVTRESAAALPMAIAFFALWGVAIAGGGSQFLSLCFSLVLTGASIWHFRLHVLCSTRDGLVYFVRVPWFRALAPADRRQLTDPLAVTVTEGRFQTILWVDGVRYAARRKQAFRFERIVAMIGTAPTPALADHVQPIDFSG